METKRKVGRPLSYPSLELLQAAINNYFESCWEEWWVELPTTNEDGHITGYHWYQKRDKDGNPRMIQTTPYTMAGLALALNTSRSTIINYEFIEEYVDAIKEARCKCEAYVESGMLNTSVPAVPAIFNLKNNYHWKDKSEIDQTTRAVVRMDKIKRDGEDLDFDIGEKADDS